MEEVRLSCRFFRNKFFFLVSDIFYFDFELFFWFWVGVGVG